MTNDHRGARYYDPFLALVAAKEAHQIGTRIYTATTTEYIRPNIYVTCDV